MQEYSAALRLHYLGAQGRYKGDAQLWVRRPASLRYEVQGPHGGVLLAFATDGHTLMALDMPNNSLVRGRASAANFDALLPLAPLDLDAAGWVALLFGEVRVPDTATLSYDDAVGLFWLAWRRGTQDVRLGVDPSTFAVRRATGSQDQKMVWCADIAPRDAAGLPTALRLRAPSADIDLELRWRDVDTTQPLVDAMFVLPIPRGVSPKDLP